MSRSTATQLLVMGPAGDGSFGMSMSQGCAILSFLLNYHIVSANDNANDNIAQPRHEQVTGAFIFYIVQEQD